MKKVKCAERGQQIESKQEIYISKMLVKEAWGNISPLQFTVGEEGR